MSARPQYRVGVVGFGIAGAAAAYLLARDGHAVTLLERAAQVGPIGAGLLLQPTGQAVLRRMGLLDRVVSEAAPIDELHAVHPNGRTLIRMPYGEFEPDCRAYGVHRGALFAALRDAVASQPVQTRLGAEVVRLVVRPGGVVLQTAAGEAHGPFDFVIAADGSRSRVRSLAGLRAWLMPYDHGALWATAPCDAIRNKLYQVVRGTRYLLGVLPIGGGRCSLYWGVPECDLHALQARGLAALKDELIAFCPEVRGLLDSITRFDQLVYTSYRHVWMPRWFTRHVIVIGDAAHAMSPHLAQGGSLALLDAWTLAACLNAAPDHHSAFRLYRRRRAAHVRYYGGLTFLLSPFFQGDSVWKAAWRNRALPVLPRLPWVRGQMLLTMAGLKNGWVGGRLRV